MGFLLEGEHLPTIYVSGDNASLEVVSAIAMRCPTIDVAVLFCGAARTVLCDYQNLTLGSEEAVVAARILGFPIVVPAHFEGWGHFTEGADTLRQAFERATEHLRLLERGEVYDYPAAMGRG
jgi:L-ascorbate metabolism protein UlaG (beta-lactamase superfamily)